MASREEFIQKALWDAYLKLDRRQRAAFENMVAQFGIASVLISLKPDKAVPFSRELVFGSATFFVFVTAGRFYFLSAYLF